MMMLMVVSKTKTVYRLHNALFKSQLQINIQRKRPIQISITMKHSAKKEKNQPIQEILLKRESKAAIELCFE